MTARPNPRDPLTQRLARSLAETTRDPWSYSEGPAEPQLLEGARAWKPGLDVTQRGHRAVTRVCVIGLVAFAFWALSKVAA